MFKRSKRFFLPVVATLTISLLLTACGGNNGGTSNTEANGGGSAADDKPTYTFRLAETHAPDYPTTLADYKFAELVKERSDGRITIDVFPSAQLGEEKAVLEQVQLGAIEFTRVSTGPMAEFNQDFGVFSLPYIFDNDEHLWNFLNGEHGAKLLGSLEDSRMKGLAYYSAGSRHFYSRTPITSLEDLQGLKIRVQQNKLNIDLMEALGASATPMDFGEVYSGLQTGVIDAAENNYPSYYSTRHYEVANHLILDGHQRLPEVLLISKMAWDKLSDEDKEIIEQAAKDSVEYQLEEWAKFEHEAEEQVRAAGVTITEVDDISKWQAAVQTVIDEHGAAYQEVLDAIQSARP
ncbi:TRAP transporter substrate-binding protein [Paenibacillus abyssi]|uniref:C4-dicarboxylate ABC transporter n=1 Tax=Paenibacillus abyssi TaxID=1340531 RepID=A0A917FTH2_9BACL|nr:TRAP transporter substrate-binding protein [Paenibacillus abyssi]GGG00330.1 C4-dicarboxylate ABC transporter [Paenibacillus abyssi]